MVTTSLGYKWACGCVGTLCILSSIRQNSAVIKSTVDMGCSSLLRSRHLQLGQHLMSLSTSTSGYVFRRRRAAAALPGPHPHRPVSRVGGLGLRGAVVLHARWASVPACRHHR